MRALKITYKSPDQLKARTRNPRTHTKRQIRQIAASIKEFGFISEDVPLFVEHCEAAVAEVDVTRR